MSLCTGYPFDVPVSGVWIMSKTKIERPIYGVKRWDNKAPTEFMGTAEEVVQFIAAQLPPDCGPARKGTANDT